MRPALDVTLRHPLERAKVHQRKKRRAALVAVLERISPLRDFFTGGVEIDDGLPIGALLPFTAQALRAIEQLRLPPAWGRGVEIKIRRLGQHRADGLYFPDPPVLALGTGTLASFAHELGHLLDYRARFGRMHPDRAPVLSREPAFAPFHARLLERMREAGLARVPGSKSGRISWRYFSSPSECFARAFEQLVAERVSHPSVIVADAARYRGDPLYFDALPPALGAYFQDVIRTEAPGPCQFPLVSGAACQENAGLQSAQSQEFNTGGSPCLDDTPSAAGPFSDKLRQASQA